MVIKYLPKLKIYNILIIFAMNPRLWVGNIPQEWNDEDIKIFFGKKGALVIDAVRKQDYAFVVRQFLQWNV